MAQPLKIESNQKKLRANEVKWGVELIEAGWTMIPSIILEHQEALGLAPVDMNILLQLARYWWRADNPPHPAIDDAENFVSRLLLQLTGKMFNEWAKVAGLCIANLLPG